MVEVLYSKGITTGSVEIDVVQGEHMEGVTTQSSIVFKENGYAGYFIPLKMNKVGNSFHMLKLKFQLLELLMKKEISLLK